MFNVLIVEDDPAIALLLEEQLEADGYSVTGIARTVAEAVAAAQRQSPDYAVIDVHLAGGDLGTDAARRLCAMSSVRILFSTGDNDENLSSFQGQAVLRKPYRIRDVGRGLKIVDELAQFGRTELSPPRNFQIICPASEEVA